MSVFTYLNIPTSIQNMIIDGTVERLVLDPLEPMLLFSADCTSETLEAAHGGRVGDNGWISKPSLLTPKVSPLAAGTDPIPETYNYESFGYAVKLYSGAVHTDMSQAGAMVARKWAEDAHNVGQQFGASRDSLARLTVYRAALSGNTRATALGSTSAALPVASCNGFAYKMVNGRPEAVSASNLLTITLGSATAYVQACTPTAAADPFGPGVLTLSAATSWSENDKVIASDASYIYRPNSRVSTHDIISTDVATLAGFRDLTARLDRAYVPRFADGYYHAQVDPVTINQLHADTEFKTLMTGQVSNEIARTGYIDPIYRIRFIVNPLSPRTDNVLGDPTAGLTAVGEIGGELTSHSGVNVLRALVYGAGFLHERYRSWLDQNNLAERASNEMMAGNFVYTGNGLAVPVKSGTYIIRKPINIRQNIWTQAWDYQGGFACQTDSLALTNASRYKRCGVLEHGA